MGFFIRKSFSFGPLRFNLSKSGVGLSAGVKGLRVGVKPSGQRYVAGGREGLYFRENLSNAGQASAGIGGGPYTVTGRAIQNANGQPAVGTQLHVWMDNRPDVRTLVVTDADGRFRATGFPAGDFTISPDAALLQTLTVILDPDGLNGCLAVVLIAVGLAIVIFIVLAWDGDVFKGPGRTSPLGKMDYNARPAEVPTPFPEVPTPEPFPPVAGAAPVEEPTPTGQGTITMHGKTIPVQRK